MATPAKTLVLVVDGLFAATLLALAALLLARADSGPLLAVIAAGLLLLPLSLFASLAWALGRVPRPVWGRHARVVATSITAVVLVMAYAAGTAAVDRSLAHHDFSRAYADCHKVWATRGLVAPGLTKVAAAGNNAATVNNAFAHGAHGVEVDVYYDPARADFVVSHDFPYEAKDGALLMLAQLLAQTDPTRHYWLDFKRHGQLTRRQAEAAADRLAAIADARGMPRERLWVEGTEPFNLMPFERAGFSIIFDVHPPADDHALTPVVTEMHKAVFVLGGFTVMGMNYGTAAAPIYGPVARQHLGDIPVFLYHVPTDRALLARLAGIPQVRVLMAGDHSAMVYDIDACAPAAAGVP